MKKPVIGIIPSAHLFTSIDPYDDYYKFINLYSKAITLSNGIPIGLLGSDNKIDESALELCDGFLIQGGHKIELFVYEIILYAIRKNKPLLGICMGSEAIAICSKIWDENKTKEKITTKDIEKTYQALKQKWEGTLLIRLPENHFHNSPFTPEDINAIPKHTVTLKKDSLIYDIYQKEKIEVYSFHSFDYKTIGTSFSITGQASDGVKEVIEYNDKNHFILGVHFHPELVYEKPLFERLIKEAKKRRIKENENKM